MLTAQTAENTYGRLITLPQVVEQSRTRHGKNTAFQMYEGNGIKSYTYSQVCEICRKVGAGLQSLGIQKGDRVALLCRNCPEWGLAFFSIVAIGAIAVPLDVEMTGEELALFLGHSEAKAAFVGREFVARIRPLRDGLPSLGHVVAVDGAADDAALSLEGLERRGVSPANETDSTEPFLDDPASIVYAAGAPGFPRGTVLSHRNLVFDSLACLRVTPYKPDDRFLSLIPLFHGYEFIGGFLSPFIAGSTITYASTLRPHKLMKIMRELGITKMVGVPLLFSMFHDVVRDKIRRAPLRSRMAFAIKMAAARVLRDVTGIRVGKRLFRGIYREFGGRFRYAICGGAAPDMGMLNFFDLLGIQITQGYGLTEAAPVIAVNPPERNKLRSVGIPLPGLEVAIRKPDQQGVGEILVRGPNVMRGYYRNEKATRGVFDGDWLRTGDLGYLDGDGYLFFAGRSKPVIVLQSGKNVYPDEVERAYLRSPLIKEICVLPSEPPTEQFGDAKALRAIVVPDAEKAMSAAGSMDMQAARRAVQDEMKRISREITVYRRVGEVQIREGTLPRLPGGALDRESMLREWQQEWCEKSSASNARYFKNPTNISRGEEITYGVGYTGTAG